MDEMIEMSVELSKFLTNHIEKFACAFAKETGLDPTKIKMVQQSLDNGFGYNVWFEPFPKESDIEFYRVQAEHARVRAEKAEAMVERLIEAGNWLNAMHEDGVFVDELNAARTSWKLAVSDWQSMPSHVTNPLESQGIVTRNGGEG